MTRIQHVKLCDKEDNYTFSMRITTNEKYLCWALLAGYMKYLNMFKTFVPTCQSYTDEKNNVHIDCHCHCHC